MVKKSGDKWIAECDQCDWRGEADTKKEARELLRAHLDIHRVPKSSEDRERSGSMDAPPDKLPKPRTPGDPD